MNILRKKMIIVVFMVVAMLNSILLPTYGVEYNDIDTNGNQEMYDILDAYNIFSGDGSGNFDDDKLLTRGELAKILASISGYMQYADIVQTSYSDVKGTWAENYVAITESLKISEGFNDNTFRLNATTSYETAVSKLLITMGYSRSGMSGNYPNNYIELATDLGLLDGMSRMSIGITRGQMSKLVYNALKEDLVEYSNGEFSKTGKLLFDNIGTSDRLEITSQFIVNHEEYDMSKYLGNICDIYFDIDRKVVLIRNPKYEMETGIVNSVMDSNNMFIKENYGSIVIKNIDINNVIYNYAHTVVNASDYIGSEITMLKEDDDIVKIILNKSEDSDILKYEDYYEGLSSMIKNTLDDEYIERVFGMSSDQLKSSDLKNCYINIYGDANSFEEIKENDLIKYYPSNSEDFKYLGIKVISNSICGIFNGYKLMDGMEYISVDYKLYQIKNEPSETLIEGDKICGVLDEENQIVKLYVTNYYVEPTKLAMITEIKTDMNGLPFISVLDESASRTSYSLTKYSGYVEYRLNDDNSREYYTTLNEGDYIYYSLKDENHIKKIEKLDTVEIEDMTIYDHNQSEYIFTKDTSIINANYDVLSLSDLKAIVSGKAYVAENGNILMFYIESNEDMKWMNITVPDESVDESIKNDESKITTEIMEKAEDEDKDKDEDKYEDDKSISVDSAIGVIDLDRTTEDKLYLLDEDEYIKISDTLNIDKYEGKYITLTAKNGILSTITAYEPDGVSSKVTKLYENQVQLFGFSYIEFDENIKVYICSTDSKGYYTSFEESEINKLQIGGTIDYYDTYGNYDGVIDIIIIHK